MRWLKALPCAQRLSSMALVHASPSDLWRAPLPDASNEELCEVFGGLETPMVVYAHIHRPFVREMATMTVANTGSVSLSYDGDARASYAVVEDGKVEIRRVEYDVKAEVQAGWRAGLPHGEWVEVCLQAGKFVAP